MRKYTVEELKKDLIVIRCNKKEQAWKLIDAWELKPPVSKHNFYDSDNFTILYSSQRDLNWVDERKTPNYFKENNYKMGGEIDFSQIDFQEKGILESIEIY